MAVTYRRNFRVRQYECDAYGHLNNVNYLRFLQEAAIEASAAAGYDLEWYQHAGYRWLVRETEVEYLRSLKYGDTVEVTTWVADLRRVRSRRAYELRSPPGGELAARAQTDWVYLNSASGQPAPIPPAMSAAFLPEGPPPPAPRAAGRPRVPPAPPAEYVMRRRVRFQDIDQAQHVNNAVYLAYAEDCGFQVATHYGWPPARLAAEGLAVILQRQYVQYHTPAVQDDEVQIRTWLYDVRRVRFTRYYALARAADGVPLAEVHCYYVLADWSTLKPVRFPPGFIESFAENIAPGNGPG